MKISFCLLIVFAVVGQALSQDITSSADSTAVDSVRVKKPRIERPVVRNGFWLAAYLEPAYLSNAGGANLGIGASFVYKGQYHAGVYGVVFRGDYSERLIFPNQFSMKYGHLGLWMGYRSKAKSRFRFTADLRAGQGKVFWERKDNFFNLFEDYALFVQPSLGVDYKVGGFMAVHTELGYRRVYGLELPHVSNADFSGLSTNIMIKIGSF